MSRAVTRVQLSQLERDLPLCGSYPLWNILTFLVLVMRFKIVCSGNETDTACNAWGIYFLFRFNISESSEGRAAQNVT